MVRVRVWLRGGIAEADVDSAFVLDSADGDVDSFCEWRVVEYVFGRSDESRSEIVSEVVPICFALLVIVFHAPTSPLWFWPLDVDVCVSTFALPFTMFRGLPYFLVIVRV